MRSTEEHTTALSRLFRAFKIADRRPHGGKGHLKVMLTLPSAGEPPRRRLVGTLSIEDGKWSFAYGPDYADDDRLPAISPFPQKSQRYESTYLWPFFLSRLPEKGRKDIDQAIRELGLEDAGEIELLGQLSRRAVSSPYEFELESEAD